MDRHLGTNGSVVSFRCVTASCVGMTGKLTANLNVCGVYPSGLVFSLISKVESRASQILLSFADILSAY